MGVAGLWEILKPAAETRSMTELAITEGFVANPRGLRGFRIGIDASIWFFHAEYGKEGENPVLRTLFFRCATLMRTTFLPLFVFDGPKRPDFKRGKKINKTSHKLIPGMKAIVEAFGFEWRMAPAEAEAELAYLNSVGIIDGILSDDVDNFLFGATTVIRNTSNNLSGNRANPILNSQGKDDKNHTRLYRASKIRSHSSISLTRGGLILIGLLSGGDYAQAGLPGCGITTAHALACCGFGDSLYEAAITLPHDALPDFLTTWRQKLREELRTNSRGIIGRKLAKLAKAVPESFPNIDILLSYTSPITSESLGRAAEKNLKLTWSKEPDVGKLAALCEFYFEWGYKEMIIKRFRKLLWHSVVLRILRRAVINTDIFSSSSSSITPTTPHKNKDAKQARVINTPSKMITKYFASLDLDSPSQSCKNQGSESDNDEECLIIKIHSSRNHTSTDDLLEYRLEVSPIQLVQLAESGIKGTREPPEKDEWASDGDAAGDDDDSDTGKKVKGPKPPPDPASHLRLWMPACMIEIAEPKVVEEYKERETKKLAKKKGKSKKESGAAKKTKAKASSSSKRLEKQLYESDLDERQVIDDMLLRRAAPILSSPSRSSNVRKTKVRPVPEESEESESDVLPSILNNVTSKSTTRARAESSKAAERRVVTFNYVSLSEEESERNQTHKVTTKKPVTYIAPAPSPISLENDDDIFSSSDTYTHAHTQPHALTTSEPTTHPQTSGPDSKLHKSPRKSLKYSPPHRLAESHNTYHRFVSPAPKRPPARNGSKTIGKDMSVIEISSNDDSDDSDVGPNLLVASLARSKVPPLLLAKARSKTNKGSGAMAKRRTSEQRYRNADLSVIDLT
ncbi:hypothetical protein AX15_002064 [Amanita polypyramis BW_CC]|nr:hypothetical protein AX15_002064 [Amanita polypyramis BW_CC]